MYFNVNLQFAHFYTLPNFNKYFPNFKLLDIDRGHYCYMVMTIVDDDIDDDDDNDDDEDYDDCDNSND